MDSQRKDIMSSAEQLISIIKNFRGPDAYVIDTIHKVSALPVKLKTDVTLDKVSDVESEKSYDFYWASNTSRGC